MLRTLVLALAITGFGLSQAAFADCKQSYQSMPSHKIANQRACKTSSQAVLLQYFGQAANWSQPAHKVAHAAPSHNQQNHVLVVQLPWTPASASWAFPLYQQANWHKLSKASSFNPQGRKQTYIRAGVK